MRKTYNMNEMKSARYLNILDVTTETPTKTNLEKLGKKIPLTIIDVKVKEKNETNVFYFVCQTDNKEEQVLFNEITFADTPLGWTFHKDFLTLTEAESKINTKEYSPFDLIGFTFDGYFEIEENQYFKPTKENSKPFKYNLAKVSAYTN